MLDFVHDEYSEILPKEKIFVSVDREMLYWIDRLSDMNKQQNKDNDTRQRIIRTALYLYLKHKLPNHFKMSEEYFMHSNERTGKYGINRTKW